MPEWPDPLSLDTDPHPPEPPCPSSRGRMRREEALWVVWGCWWVIFPLSSFFLPSHSLGLFSLAWE